MKNVTFKNLTEEQINAIKVLLGDACDIEEKMEEDEASAFPSEGDEFFYILSDGGIADDLYAIGPTDRGRQSIGNIFKTQEEAEFEAERLRVIHEMKKFAFLENDAWNIDISHYYFYYDVAGNFIDIGSSYAIKRQDVYFKSRGDAKACLDEVGEDRIKKYYFRIED